jgi:uncharacterized cupin superfamily protein
MSTETTTPTIAKAHVSTAQLDPWPIPREQVIDGDPRASGVILWKSDDGTLANGIWECTPGTFSWVHANETLCLVEGHVTVTPENGEPFDISPGDIVFFPEGTKTQWHVTEKLRKGFQLQAAGGLGL